MELKFKKIIAVLLLALAAVVSFTFVADLASGSGTNAAAVESIDDKIDTVLKLTGTAAVSSAAVSAIPGDTATPIAEKLADFSQYFLLVLCVLYAEKYLLGILGIVSFKILIPVACCFFAAALFSKSESVKRIGTKLVIFALVIFITIPISIRVSDMIDTAYQGSVMETIAEAEDFSDLTASFPDDSEDTSSFWSTLWDKFSETATSLTDRAADILKNMVEAMAVLIVTSCVIPVLTLLFFIWFFKLVTGIEIRVPTAGAFRPEPPREAPQDHTA